MRGRTRFVEEGRPRGYSIVEGRTHDDLLMAAIRGDDSPSV
jgi:hypothetical protein